MKPYYEDTQAGITIYHGDCRAVMPTLDADSVDAIVTDPPYGLGFMGKDWDYGVPGVHFWREALRVAKPGAHLLAFGGTRTFHRLACAIEDAGWQIRDTLGWLYGSGFPKSLNIGKAIDKAAGAEREVLDSYERQGRQAGIMGKEVTIQRDITAPATDAAKQWDGWGTALKPAWEPIIVARKPLIGTVANNVLTHGTGGLNIDGCRVGTSKQVPHSPKRVGASKHTVSMPGNQGTSGWDANTGRFPANIIHDGSDEVLEVFPQTMGAGNKNPTRIGHGRNVRFGDGQNNIPASRFNLDNGGSAARFFYCAKASKSDRDEGCDELPVKQSTGGGGMNDPNGDDVCGKFGSVKAPARNPHPTVKPTALMRYLCKLVTPPNGIILDPFMGSGSTGKAAIIEGFRFIGIELDAGYCEIARARIAARRMGQEVFNYKEASK